MLFIMLGVLLVLTALLLAVGHYFYQYALTPRRGERAPGVTDEAYSRAAAQFAADDRNWTDDACYDIWITAGDGLRLRAHRADADGSRYAILAHGYTADGRSMAPFGKHFHDMGFTVLMPDMRGHGASDGHYIGMGWHDRKDILAWIDTIAREDPESEIILFGISMGGATVMMTSGEPLPGNVKAIIEDCGYTSVWDEFAGQLKAQFGLPPFPVMYAASAVTWLRAGFRFSEADAAAQVAKSVTPILFIHGEEDRFVPYGMLDVLYQAANCDKERLSVPGAGHGTACAADPVRYWAAVEAFIGKYTQDLPEPH